MWATMTMSLFPRDPECAILMIDRRLASGLHSARAVAAADDELVNRSIALATLLVALAGCMQSREPVPVTPPAETKGAAVVRRPLPETAPTAPATASLAPARVARESPVVVPPGVIYVCVSASGGAGLRCRSSHWAT